MQEGRRREEEAPTESTNTTAKTPIDKNKKDRQTEEKRRTTHPRSLPPFSLFSAFPPPDHGTRRVTTGWVEEAFSNLLLPPHNHHQSHTTSSHPTHQAPPFLSPHRLPSPPSPGAVSTCRKQAPAPPQPQRPTKKKKQVPSTSARKPLPPRPPNNPCGKQAPTHPLARFPRSAFGIPCGLDRVAPLV